MHEQTRSFYSDISGSGGRENDVLTSCLSPCRENLGEDPRRGQAARWEECYKGA